MTFAENRRTHPRIRTLLEGRAVFNDRYSLIECMVLDLSEGGGRIEFATTFEPPPVFELEVPKKHLRVWAQRTWSRGNQHGLKFFEPSAKGQMGPLTQAKAAQLEQILDEARKNIAEVMGIPAEQVKLTVDLPSNEAA